MPVVWNFFGRPVATCQIEFVRRRPLRPSATFAVSPLKTCVLLPLILVPVFPVVAQTTQSQSTPVVREIIEVQQINQAYERLVKNDVKYRFVIDLASLK